MHYTLQLPDFAPEKIRILASLERRRLLSHGIPAHETESMLEDFASRLAAAAYRALAAFNPEEGASLRHFVSRCLENEAASFRRSAVREKSRADRLAPLDEAEESAVSPRHTAKSVILRDIAAQLRVFAQYHPREAAILAQYAAGCTLSEIADMAKISRKTMYRRTWPRIRALAHRFFA